MEGIIFQAWSLLNQGGSARDPAFLLAYCRLAEAHDELYFQGAIRIGPSRSEWRNAAIKFRLFD